jgi:hypothetical protein
MIIKLTVKSDLQDGGWRINQGSKMLIPLNSISFIAPVIRTATTRRFTDTVPDVPPVHTFVSFRNGQFSSLVFEENFEDVLNMIEGLDGDIHVPFLNEDEMDL